MDRQTDVAIVGGGLASLATAVELMHSGLEVTLISKGPGSASLSSGAWDLCDSPLRFPGEEMDRLPSVGQNLSALLCRRPSHPFHLLSEGREPDELFSHLQKKTLQVAEVLPMALEGDGSNMMAALTEMGTIKPTTLLQGSMAGGDLRGMKDAKILVLGIEGLAQFNARFIRQCLEDFQKHQQNSYFELVGNWEISLPSLKSQNSLSPFEVAQALDREEVFVQMGKQINDYLKGKIYSHLILPPVLGLQRTTEIVEALNRITGRVVAEALSFSAGVPGWRLHQAIREFFTLQGYDQWEGEVVGFEAKAGSVQSLTVHLEEERIRLSPKAVILATGRFLGGGLRHSPPFRESIFGLPLYMEGREGPLDPSTLKTLEDYEARQPWRTLGIRVNSRARPIDSWGESPYENLFAAGQILSGWDPAMDRSVAGVSILSGTLAGRNALKFLKNS